MNDSHALSIVTDNVDDTCSCDSVYHSLSNTPVDELLPPVPALDLSTAPANAPSGPNTFNVPEFDSRATKDERSHELARQRLKKPEDVRKAKRCVRCRLCKPEKWAGNAGRPKQSGSGRGFRASLKEAEGERRQALSDSIESVDECAGTIAMPSSRIVALADFVKPARRTSDKQFEIIGRPRQVLVMDEFTEVDSMLDLDDWEYVEAEAKHRKAILKAPTYARVVATRA